tara:strand:+ start:284 stop:484 length:201 start_codon:yes stop_codon:yes gene_type:complete
MTSLKSIGKNIEAFRKTKGMTQEDLAGFVEMDRSFLSHIENGRKNFSIDLFLRIAKALEVDPQKLI